MYPVRYCRSTNKATKIGSGSRLVDWVYIDDVVEGLIAAACVPDLPYAVDLGSEFWSVADMHVKSGVSLVGRISWKL